MKRKPLFLTTVLILLLASCGRQSIAPTPTPTTTPTSTPAATPTANARAGEYPRMFETVWQTINDEYFDPTFGGVDWQGVHESYRPLIAAAQDDETFYELINKMLFELNVSHVAVVPPDEKEQIDTVLYRSGLPLTMITASFGEYDSLRKLADGAGERGPDFEPGSAFQYSDTGFDVLGALVEVISGVPLQQFVQERILDPLGMADTVTLIEAGDPRTDRITSLYFGAQGEWSRIWSPEEEPLYPFAMGSQSLYSTPLDYARFLTLWMDEGRAGDEQLLSPEAVQRALTPVSDGKLPGAFPGLRLDYGQAWIIYVPEDAPEGEGEMALLGHSGSDGTWAWAWPDQDLMVLYFTQSRGQGTGIALENEIDRLLIHPDRKEVETPAELKPYLGAYTALSGPLMNKEFEILVQNGRLAVNLPEQIVVTLEDPDAEGLWKLSLDPSVVVSFVQDEAGQVTALQWHQAGQVLEVPRGTAPEEPPLDLDAVQKYLGAYERPEEEGSEPVEVLIHNGRLAVKIPEVTVVLELYPPDEEGKWYMRLNPTVAISFQEDEDGNVVSFTAHSPEGDFVRPRVE